MEIGEPVLSGRVRIDGAVTEATFSAGGQLCWADRRLDFGQEVLGFAVDGLKIKIRTAVEQAGFCSFSGASSLVRKTFTLELFSDDCLRLWTQKLYDYLESLGRPKRLFIFVNPYGGKKLASKIFHGQVKPLLDDANVHYTVQVTEHQLHAKEVAQSLDLAKYDGLACVSGDGILVEIINGLLNREDWNNAIKIPLGVVPGGTGNGMIKSLLDSNGKACTPSNATMAIIQGRKRALDVATISQGSIRFFCVLTLAWGLVADIDIESEKYRWMGSTRFDFYALQRIFGLRKYNGSIVFVPAPGYEHYGEPSDPEKEIFVEGQSKTKSAAPNGYPGPRADVESYSWRKIDGPFVSVWLQNVPWGNESANAAPNAEFADGCLDLILTKDIPRFSLLKSMSELNTGGHVKSPFISYLKVKAFALHPGSRTDDPDRGGIIDVDGEVIARGKRAYQCQEETPMSYNKLLITVDQGLATLFSPS